MNSDDKRPVGSLPELDECYRLIMRMIEVAVRDYINLEASTTPIEQYYFSTAQEFIFNDNYKIDYGGVEKSLNDLLDILDIDLEWFREKTLKAKKAKLKRVSFKKIIKGGGHRKPDKRQKVE